MGFLKGKVKEVNTTPQDIRPLRSGISQQLLQGLNGSGLAGLYGGVLGGGQPPTQDTAFFYQNILKPYTDLFAAQRANALGQAKESAGNLTGSGYQNILGTAAAGSLAGEQAQTADVLLNLRQQEIQRQQNLLGMLFQYASAGAGGNQAVYQPGALDAILPFAGNVAGQYFAQHGFPHIGLPSWLGGNRGAQGTTLNPFDAPGSSFQPSTANPFGSPGTAFSGYQSGPYGWGTPGSPSGVGYNPLGLRLGRR